MQSKGTHQPWKLQTEKKPKINQEAYTINSSNPLELTEGSIRFFFRELVPVCEPQTTSLPPLFPWTQGTAMDPGNIPQPSGHRAQVHAPTVDPSEPPSADVAEDQRIHPEDGTETQSMRCFQRLNVGRLSLTNYFQNQVGAQYSMQLFWKIQPLWKATPWMVPGSCSSIEVVLCPCRALNYHSCSPVVTELPWTSLPGEMLCSELL